ncbi:X-box-binding 1 [Brachionus plicatilis]|uniref:X-box-binding protein 1 n=1 Tax=Brachionus plicatilis TaxID=10195 RepID=A0A3M7RW03_BRAPC|nr:X-box-binding 1 [Brachionus plicatilis]
MSEQHIGLLQKFILEDFTSEINDDSNGIEQSLFNVEVLSHEKRTVDSMNEEKPKKKRQRLNSLSQDEKLVRRKLKNRVAAQNARDRKKIKMENLEKEIALLQEQNVRLKNENNLLKEKSKILTHENKKLIKYKTIVEASQFSKEEKEDKKSRLENEVLCVEVVRSAVSVSRVSLPQKLLQAQLFQILVCFLMYASLNRKQKACSVRTKTPTSLYSEQRPLNEKKTDFNFSTFEEVIDEENATLNYLLMDSQNQIELIDIEKIDRMIDEISTNLLSTGPSEFDSEHSQKFDIETELNDINSFKFENNFNLDLTSFDPCDLISASFV